MTEAEARAVPVEKVVRERIYFGEPWNAPAWRAQWVEPFAPREPDPSPG